ncbi:MAG: response regulator [Gammaproteobacteria bacterium]|nr:MAG: response regulator [Gammaproteobacteria bacterium]
MPNKRALIVDDSSTAQYRLKKMLRSYSLDIDTADSGEAALRYLAHQSPDVIFMDHLMPGMDGFRALQIIKSHPETATIPVIMYTSKSGDLYTGQARALGALDVVSKDTINAADLSKVMEAIHIFRNKKPTEEETAEPVEAEVIDTLPDLSEPKIERRAPHPASIEQSRNLELRLGHMELALEDNRRFITARVARELNALRHSLKKEISELITHNQQPALEGDEAIAPAEVPVQRSSVFSKLIFLAALIAIIFFCVHIVSLLSESQQQQQELALQVAALAAQKPVERPVSTIAPTAAASTLVAAKDVKSENYLTDLAWTFNQNGQLPFYQNRIEPKKLVQLYELLNRISSSGFKGDAWITLFVGNFCLAMDNYGVAQIPKDTANMSECVFSSEIYGLDRVMEEYTHDAEAALNNLEQASDKNIRVIISTVSEPDNYPERKTTLTAKAWNNAAQNHNRVELRLEPVGKTAAR